MNTFLQFTYEYLTNKIVENLYFNYIWKIYIAILLYIKILFLSKLITFFHFLFYLYNNYLFYILFILFCKYNFVIINFNIIYKCYKYTTN